MSDLGFSTSEQVPHRRWRGCLAGLVALAILGGGATVLALKGRDVLAGALTIPDYTGPGQGSVVVQVVGGQTSQDIAATLRRRHVVKSEEAFAHAAKRDSRSRTIQPGFYRLHEHMSGVLALRLMLDPDSRIRGHVTVPEGVRLSDALALLARRTGIARREFARVVAHPSKLELPSYAHGHAEGFLFPATYEIDPGTTAQSLLRQMVDRYRVAERELALVDDARRIHKSPRQVVIVASLIAREARLPRDYPKVARVIYNRLHAGMRLQLDSTVHYAVGDADRVTTSDADRASSSPYNTYRHAGLPPGPIDAPGELALQAALHPAPGDWMYFVTVNPDSGRTEYAVTGAQHSRNVAMFHRWCDRHPGRC